MQKSRLEQDEKQLGNQTEISYLNSTYSSRKDEDDEIENQGDDCNYQSNLQSDKVEESYQEFLNNADLDPNEEQEINMIQNNINQSNEKHKFQGATKQQKKLLVVKKQQSSQKNTARNNKVTSNPSQFQSQTPLPVSQKQIIIAKPTQQLQKHLIPQYRPPTTQNVRDDKQKPIGMPKIKQKTPIRSKKASVASSEYYQSNLQSIVTSEGLRNLGGDLNILQNQQLMDQMLIYKQLIGNKDKKIKKHKDQVSNLKLNLQNVQQESKQQKEMLELQKKELKVLKAKLGI